MKTNRICVAGILSLSFVLLSNTTVRANDLVDFLRALNGVSNIQNTRHDSYPGTWMYPGRDTVPVTVQRTSAHPVGGNVARPVVVPTAVRNGVPVSHREPAGRVQIAYHPSTRGIVDSRTFPDHPSRVSSRGRFPTLRAGDIVSGSVPVARNVRVRGTRSIATGAVPVVVAIHDPVRPYCPVYGQLAFVQVWAPSCPPQAVVVSPCGTRVDMFYPYNIVRIRSGERVLSVEYES